MYYYSIDLRRHAFRRALKAAAAAAGYNPRAIIREARNTGATAHYTRSTTDAEKIRDLLTFCAPREMIRCAG